ncbi:unnamed protein product [Ostreobium quekettii]|uniref:60S ribosomal protein L24 n=1 Tax=Ostreobium quekettii TaxID=121088 RepID=A0A8S1J689_9CHLO|nr:unnamed protein product [Ostreobium quekettii]
MYRKQHKKDQTTDSSRRKRRTHQKVTLRSIVGASLEVIQKKRNEKPEVRQAARDAALREVKERMRKSKDAKKATGGKTQAGGKVEKAARSRGGKQGGKTGAGGLR